jgi:hypothetical protein
MSNTNIDFQGNWPERLKAQVEDLILQHETGGANGSSPRAASPPDGAQRRQDETQPLNASGESAREKGLWIAQHNPSPTGPLYAVGRTCLNGHNALGPVITASGSELLDKLRTLLGNTKSVAE